MRRAYDMLRTVWSIQITHYLLNNYSGPSMSSIVLGRYKRNIRYGFYPQGTYYQGSFIVQLLHLQVAGIIYTQFMTTECQRCEGLLSSCSSSPLFRRQGKQPRAGSYLSQGDTTWEWQRPRVCTRVYQAATLCGPITLSSVLFEGQVNLMAYVKTLTRISFCTLCFQASLLLGGGEIEFQSFLKP